METLINKYAHCATYKYASEEYMELNNLSETVYSALQEGLAEAGYAISYNNIDECYCVY